MIFRLDGWQGPRIEPQSKKPEEIAEIVYFLSSENNTYLTGQKIVVDGGFSGK